MTYEKNLVDRITYYLSSGGLFNPELADHLAVRNLLMECREALAQPEQEPVGWLDGDDHLAEFMHKDLKAEHDRRKSSTPKAFYIPVYTTPPQRKPLTDEEIDKAWRSCDYTVPWEQHRIDIARAIEAAHGIKGEA